jgi:hypothetical protein
MPLLVLLALLAFTPTASASTSCAVVPGSIPAGSVQLKDVLAKAQAAVEKPENLEIAVFGLG